MTTKTETAVTRLSGCGAVRAAGLLLVLSAVLFGQAAVEFNIPTVPSSPGGIVSGPDGNLWFTESACNKIGRITTGGSVAEFAIPTPGYPWGIASGPDGNLWFTESSGNKIGRISTSGSVTEFPIPTTNSNPFWIASGPDGNLWFTE